MARFYEEVEFEIEPYDFLEKCSKREIQTVCEILEDQYGVMSTPTNSLEKTRGVGYKLFIDDLAQLAKSWNFISKEDLNILNNLATKYKVK